MQELRRQIIKFERTVQKNTEMRTRFSDDPSKYVVRVHVSLRRGTDRCCNRYLDSEEELDKAFTFFYPLTQDPIKYYPEISGHETLVSTLVNLLAHENTDISLQAIGVLYELTDEDVGEELIAEVGDDDEDDEKREEIAKTVRLAMGGLMTTLVSANRPAGALWS